MTIMRVSPGALARPSAASSDTSTVTALGFETMDTTTNAIPRRAFPLGRFDLAALSISELDALCDALLAAEGVIADKLNSGRIYGTPLHGYLSARVEGLAHEIDAIATEMLSRQPSSGWEAQERAHRLIMHACRCGESPADIAKLAQDLARPETH